MKQRNLRFCKETDGRWYVDLPEWTGAKSDLEMITGAGSMIDMMAEGNPEVLIKVSDTYFENSNEIEFIRMADDIGNGAYYFMEKYIGIEIRLEMWLCNVTLSVFEGFPMKIFIAKLM
jgi:hypothetical protein